MKFLSEFPERIALLEFFWSDKSLARLPLSLSLSLSLCAALGEHEKNAKEMAPVAKGAAEFSAGGNIIAVGGRGDRDGFIRIIFRYGRWRRRRRRRRRLH